MTSDHHRWMRQAIRAAARGRGASGENPAVGCVIVTPQGTLAGVGHTQPGGRPHAETEALAMAGGNARGATAYVTLEPCAHKGRTPPCAGALIRAGIKRVFIAIVDPDPRVAGRGIDMLKSKGIEVITGLLADEAYPGLAGFLNRIEKKRPLVILKLAISRDGKIAAAPGERTNITGQPFWNRVHLLRASSDAVMVGAHTVRTDDPSLTCRLPGLEDRSPVRIVAGQVPAGSKLARTAAGIPVWQLHPSATAANVEALPVRVQNDGRIDLADAIECIASRGINQLLIEGGAQIARNIVENHLADEIWLASAPVRLGASGVDALAGLPLAAITADERFILCHKEAIGADTLKIYRRKAS